jgi:Amt family ammonium transporter
MVRSKNSINVAQKNILDLLISVSLFYRIGFGLMFGASMGGWIGWKTSLFA